MSLKQQRLLSRRQSIISRPPNRQFLGFRRCINDRNAISAALRYDSSAVISSDTNSPQRSVQKACSRYRKGGEKVGARTLQPGTKWFIDYLKSRHQSKVNLSISKVRSFGTLNNALSRDTEQLVERLRACNEKGDKATTSEIWEDCISQGWRLPLDGLIVDELWSEFIFWALEDEERLSRLVGYARRMNVETGKSWGKIYLLILRHFMWRRQGHAYAWHLKLYHDFPPSSDDFINLINQSFEDGYNKRGFGVLRRMYEDLPIRDIYVKVVPPLCSAGRYLRALRWHQVCIEHHDFPPDISSAEPILDYLSGFVPNGPLRGLHEPERASLLAETLAKFSSAGVPIPPRFISKLEAIPITSVPKFSRELVYRGMGEAHGIQPKEINEAFCTRLFATKMFSVGSATKFLRMLSVSSLGSESLREIVLRAESDASVTQTHLDILKQNEIDIVDNTYTRLIRRLALDGNSQALHDIVTSDMHPDSYDDWQLQEELLRTYYLERKTRQFELTLTVLTVSNTRPQAYLVSRWNIFLRMHIRNQDHAAIIQALDKMHELHLAITIRTLHSVRIHLIAPRRPGRRPQQISELPLVIAIYQRALKAGTPVPPTVWKDILRRLGMWGHLRTYETLALWLADWYSSHLPLTKPGDPLVSSPKVYPQPSLPLNSRTDIAIPKSPSNISQPAGPAPSATHTTISSPLGTMSNPSNLSFSHPLPPSLPHPVYRTLTSLFPSSTQSAIIAWSFQHPFLSPSPSPTSPQWDWGLLLLRRLHTRYGVPVHRHALALALEHRLMQLFGPGKSTRRRNQRARERNTRDLGYYLEGVERIWGRGFWVDRRREHVTGWGAVLRNLEGDETKTRKQVENFVSQARGDGDGFEEISATRMRERTEKLHSTYREKRRLQHLHDGEMDGESE